MAKRLLGYDPLSGIKTYHEYDHQTKKTAIGYEYPHVDGLLDWTKYLSNTGIDSYNKRRDMKHVACVPLSIINKWRLEEGIDIFNDDHWPRVKEKLNDPDWKFLRTGSGNL
jgi:hypothetical protein